MEWSIFKTNVASVLGLAPDPIYYPRSVIYSYPFMRNKHGEIIINSENEAKAWKLLDEQNYSISNEHCDIFLESHSLKMKRIKADSRYRKENNKDELDSVELFSITQYDCQLKELEEKLNLGKLSKQGQRYLGIEHQSRFKWQYRP